MHTLISWIIDTFVHVDKKPYYKKPILRVGIIVVLILLALFWAAVFVH